MTGKEIIDGLVGEEIPTAEEIRSHAFVHGEVKKYRPLRLVKAAIALVALLVFSTAVYAVGSYIYRQRLDLGGSWEYVVVPEDCPEYAAELVDRTVFFPIFVSPNHPSQSASATGVGSANIGAVRDFMDGQVFDADGITPPANSMNLRGQTLYDADGYEIMEIYLTICSRNRPLRIGIATFEHNPGGYLGLWGCSNLYEAIAQMGREFRMPTVHLEHFSPPTFSMFPSRPVEDGVPIVRDGVNVRFEGDRDISDWTVVVAPARGDYIAPREILRPGGEITEFYEVNGVVVYRISAVNYATIYTWVYDGLVYSTARPVMRRNNPNPVEIVPIEAACGAIIYSQIQEPYFAFTDEEMREIIRSMID